MQAVSYEVNGQTLTLNESVINQFVTKGNGNISQSEAYNFMMLCKYQELNPFTGDAYLIKFGNNPAQQIVSKEALLKRANRQKNFEGMESGIVVMRKDGNILSKQGQAVYPGEQLLAGWAKVYRADRKMPTYVETSLDECGKGQATWKQMPANMIRKVAQSNALREAFPEELGAMHIEEEPQYSDGGHVDTGVKDKTTNDLASKFKAKKQEEPKEKEVKPDPIEAEFEEITEPE